MVARLPEDGFETIEVDMYYSDPSIEAPELLVDKPVDDQISPDFHRVVVRDARAIADKLSLDREGFLLRPHRATVPFEPEFLETNLTRQRDLPPINRRYAEELLPLIRELSGGDEIIPQAGRVRVRSTKRAGLLTSEGIAPLVHLDYTPRAVRDAIDLTLRLEGRDVPVHRRVALFQTWRVLTPPPHDSLLAICDAQSVSDDATIVLQSHTPPNENEPEEEVIEVRLCTFEKKHRWYYFSNMTPEEVLVFKGYDSANSRSATGAHVAFDNPSPLDLNGRISVDARYIVFYK